MSFVENKVLGTEVENRGKIAYSFDPCNNVQESGSKRKRRSNDNGKLPRKRMRPNITNPTERSDVSVEDRRISVDARLPAKKSRSSVNNDNTSDSSGIRVQTKKRKASGDGKVPKKKMKWSKGSSSSESCVTMLSAPESSDGMQLSVSSDNSGGRNFGSDSAEEDRVIEMSSSINTSRGKLTFSNLLI